MGSLKPNKKGILKLIQQVHDVLPSKLRDPLITGQCVLVKIIGDKKITKKWEKYDMRVNSSKFKSKGKRAVNSEVDKEFRHLGKIRRKAIEMLREEANEKKQKVPNGGVKLKKRDIIEIAKEEKASGESKSDVRDRVRRIISTGRLKINQVDPRNQLQKRNFPSTVFGGASMYTGKWEERKDDDDEYLLLYRARIVLDVVCDPNEECWTPLLKEDWLKNKNSRKVQSKAKLAGMQMRVVKDNFTPYCILAVNRLPSPEKFDEEDGVEDYGEIWKKAKKTFIETLNKSKWGPEEITTPEIEFLDEGVTKGSGFNDGVGKITYVSQEIEGKMFSYMPGLDYNRFGFGQDEPTDPNELRSLLKTKMGKHWKRKKKFIGPTAVGMKMLVEYLEKLTEFIDDENFANEEDQELLLESIDPTIEMLEDAIEYEEEFKMEKISNLELQERRRAKKEGEEPDPEEIHPLSVVAWNKLVRKSRDMLYNGYLREFINIWIKIISNQVELEEQWVDFWKAYYFDYKTDDKPKLKSKVKLRKVKDNFKKLKRFYEQYEFKKLEIIKRRLSKKWARVLMTRNRPKIPST